MGQPFDKMVADGERAGATASPRRLGRDARDTRNARTCPPARAGLATCGRRTALGTLGGAPLARRAGRAVALRPGPPHACTRVRRRSVGAALAAGGGGG